MNTFKITCTNGTTWTSDLDKSLSEVEESFIGRTFVREFRNGTKIHNVPCKVEQKKDYLFWIATFGCVLLAIIILNSFIPKNPNTEAVRFIESAIKAKMKDPISTQFRNVTLSASGMVCGEVNSKNSFGAYSGFRSFYGFGDSVVFEPQISDTNTLKLWLELYTKNCK